MSDARRENKFRTSQLFTATGVIGLDPYLIGLESQVKVVVEGVGVGNVISVQARILAQASFVTIGTITGANAGISYQTDTYDEIRFNCTTYSASGTPKLVVSGFYDGDNGQNCALVASTEGTATTTSTKILDYNGARTYFFIQNKGSNNIYIKFGSTQGAAQGLLIGSGASFEPSVVPVDSIWLMSDAATSAYCAVEGVAK